MKLGDIFVYCGQLSGQMTSPEIGVCCQTKVIFREMGLEILFTPWKSIGNNLDSREESWIRLTAAGRFIRPYCLSINAKKDYECIGNIFELENKEEALKHLSSPDEATRSFYVEMLKSKLNK